MVCTSQDERTEEQDFYKILELGSDAAIASSSSINSPSYPPQQPSPTDHQYAQNLILAYSTLIDPARRIEYDLKRLKSNPAHKQVPSSGSDSKIVSQVLDLSEFTQLTVDQPEEEAPDTVGGGDRFVFPCRCGGQFLISEDQMEADIEIIGCDGCSLTVKVEYQSE
ncbi:hypothetical protein H4Q26_007760 [Puccinia striiformis f. sp. tritici PST-130]|nr:hypothetical protein H4Q26_007760 [Puccinia striiformis f. sp. tritici PST-130]